MLLRLSAGAGVSSHRIQIQTRDHFRVFGCSSTSGTGICIFVLHAIAATVEKYSYMHASNRIGSDLSLCDDNDKICIFVRYDN